MISIVSDPDVWHAMMKNEKVQELKRLLKGLSLDTKKLKFLPLVTLYIVFGQTAIASFVL